MLCLDASVPSHPWAVSVRSRGTKRGNNHLACGGQPMPWMCDPLPACCDAPALPKKHKKQSSCRAGECQAVCRWSFSDLVQEMGPAKPGVLGLHQRGLHLFLGVYSWELVGLLCVQGAAGPEC